MSAASAAEQPTPAATPLTAATTGLSRLTIARMIRFAMSSARTSKFSCALSPEMSAPGAERVADAGQHDHADGVVADGLLGVHGDADAHLGATSR